VKRVIILGAGLAGLAAAYRLTRLGGYDVLVLEKEPEVGGLARSLTIQGIVTDLGPHRIHTELAEMHSFLHELLPHHLLTVVRKSQMYFRGRYLSYPISPLELLRHLGPFALGHFMLSYLLEQARGGIKKSAAANYDAAMRRAFGPALYRALILPYTKKVWGIDPQKLSADIVSVRVSAGGLLTLAKELLLKRGESAPTTLKTFIYVKGGIGRLPERLAELVQAGGGKIQISATVTDVENGRPDGCSVAYQVEGHEERAEGEFCISSIPITDLATMLLRHHPDETVRVLLHDLKYIAMRLVFIVVAKPQISPNSWLYFPEPDMLVNRAYETKNFDPTLGPSDKSLLCAEVTCYEGDEIWTMPADELVTKVSAQIARTGLFRIEDVIATSVFSIQHAYPMYDIEYSARLSKLWHFLQQFRTLMTIGRQGLFHHNNMDHSIYMGLLAAEYLHTKPKPTEAWYQDIGQFKRLRIID
jgi:protoporphyrinogen oxidase